MPLPIPTLPITYTNLQEWFPAPHVENPFAQEPWWQLQSLGLLAALQYLRLLDDTVERQQALIELRRSIDTALLRMPPPPDEEIERKLARTLAPWVPSPFPVVEKMLDLAEVQPGDRLLTSAAAMGAW